MFNEDAVWWCNVYDELVFEEKGVGFCLIVLGLRWLLFRSTAPLPATTPCIVNNEREQSLGGAAGILLELEFWWVFYIL